MKLSLLSLVFIALLGVGSLQAQLRDDYGPEMFSGKLPIEYYSLSRDQVRAGVDGIEGLSEDKADDLVNNVYFYRNSLFESGHVYIQNSVTSYVEKVLDIVLDAAPQYKDQIHVYVTRSLVHNARCFPDGSLYINLGLIADLDNESQLAFILAHEAAHYIKKHAVSDLKRLEEVSNRADEYASNGKIQVFKRLQFSRDSEFDADSYGVQLLLESPFDAMEGVKALGKLGASSDSLTDSDPNLELFKKYFDTEYCKYDTSWITDEELETVRRHAREDWGDDFFTQDFDDLLSTHPDIEKRQYALKEIIENMRDDITKSTDRKGLTGYEEIKDKAHIELIENSLREAYYFNAMYMATQLIDKYPENDYLSSAIAKSLYWISYYKEINKGKLDLKEPPLSNDRAYLRTRSVIQNLDISNTKKLSYGYVKSLSTDLKDSEYSLFYMALNTEQYLGKNASFSYYKDYLKKYPSGRYVEFVKNRTTE